ncbi:MAG: hypothetical protein ACUVTU_01545 [Desulfurispora sp.]|uniref:hypothetical protein n=1 Tax=Desulfurispora sp. TaxID=3014275 RepID=UPI004048F688
MANFTGVLLTTDASGAALAARQGLVVVIVDLIDFSTTMEAALDAGAAAVWGCAPDTARPPVEVNPYRTAALAARQALDVSDGRLILVAEPRLGSEEQRRRTMPTVLRAIADSGARVECVLPNLGAETARLVDFQGRVVLGVTSTGGVAYDAAVTAGAPAVLTGTVARTLHHKGLQPARNSARRAVDAARQHRCGIAVVAASANSQEDILAARLIMQEILVLIR